MDEREGGAEEGNGGREGGERENVCAFVAPPTMTTSLCCPISLHEHLLVFVIPLVGMYVSCVIFQFSVDMPSKAFL